MICKVTSRGQITLPAELRKAVGLQPGDTVSIGQGDKHTLEVRVLPRMRLADLIERYPITVRIDEQRDRDAWEGEAAKEVIKPE